MVKVIVGPLFESRNLIELNLRALFDVNIVGIIRDNKFFIPKGTDTINPKDVVVVVGTRSKINKLDDFFNKVETKKKETKAPRETKPATPKATTSKSTKTTKK